MSLCRVVRCNVTRAAVEVCLVRLSHLTVQTQDRLQIHQSLLMKMRFVVFILKICVHTTIYLLAAGCWNYEQEHHYQGLITIWSKTCSNALKCNIPCLARNIHCQHFHMMLKYGKVIQEAFSLPLIAAGNWQHVRNVPDGWLVVPLING